ncbi:D-methionine transport system ATP-binding protein [Cytobacillus horneckiae]|uniref:Methionine ABC transporter ATP-binding protein n=1 Tax=Cytobacillus horneckiae TaxID=549687 RepID=A0A2N0ZEL9_9BACI|nr:methionine ABC transporter ATP-binding protein [Cytobacillus horneckiae]MBN6888084.1 methionine ABC transporter ATP-binding protein [Cytobacillus horneckiae]MCM3176939.1 methionine ABC transporter ATP-binding protein [Cytobacillus horneckiae]MEC1154639.1 methionine ABC transporter ATP-binding protein [Cytobacillus horneckiae]MED2938980.1 methionine ABC transporter ATP-binding protein [Cytobacillus horneckiae]PKG27942.1 methionine ABC transporter ATP-binding protein [Cytobacillus horneckiae]
MIEVNSLVKIYSSKAKEVIGVNDVSLQIKEGEIYGIIGYSGAGKSSLIRCLNLLEKPTSGEVKIDGVDLTTLNEKALRKARQKIGMIFQHFYLASAKTVYENIAFALKAAGKTPKEIDVRVKELLELVGLSDKSSQYPAQLSGGQKQRVGIARALANNPKVLLCDEATSALDPSTTKSILNLLKTINRKLGLTIVLITHEMEVVKEICHRLAVMQDGKIIEEGLVYDIFANPIQPLTKDFIASVLQFELPQQLIENRKGTIIKIQFKGAIAEESVVSDLFQQFNVKGNILHGKIEYIQDVPLGIFIMELTGEDKEVERAIAYIEERTQNLEVVEHVA